MAPYRDASKASQNVSIEVFEVHVRNENNKTFQKKEHQYKLREPPNKV